MWVSSPFFQEKNHRSLPFKIWLPFDNSQDKIFWITYIPNAFGLLGVSCIAIGNDTLFIGFLISVGEQLDLLHHRLVNLTKDVGKTADCNMSKNNIEMIEQNLMRQHIHHHLFIFELVEQYFLL